MIYFAGVYKGILKGFLGEIAKKPILLTIDDLTVKSKKDIQLKKIISGSNHTLLLTSDSVYIRGDSEYFASGRRIMERRKEKYDPVKFQAMGIKHAVDIFTGGMHCFVKTVNNRYYGWGNNAFGQLGIGSR
jgi:alpha-tubulin suppressor-like RCC1 family protein